MKKTQTSNTHASEKDHVAPLQYTKAHVESFVKRIKNIYNDEYGSAPELMGVILDKNFSMKDMFSFDERVLESIYAIGFSQYKQGQYEAACDIFKVIVSLDHKNNKYAIALGMCYQMQQDYDQAIKFYNCIIFNSPKYAMGYIRLAQCYFKQSNWDMFNNTIHVLNKLDQIGYLKPDEKHKVSVLNSKYEIQQTMLKTNIEKLDNQVVNQ